MNSKLPIEHVIVPCTNKKISRLGDPVYYRNCHPGSPQDWIKLLSLKESPVIPAREVYCGGSWSEILNSLEHVPSARFSIVSAGYGLIDLDTPICSYQATFQSGSPDSVGRDFKTQVEANRNWWETINGVDWYLRFAEIKGIVLVQLSKVYINALMPGLLKLTSIVGDKLLIISPGYPYQSSPIANCFLPIDARFEHILKCTRSQLGASTLKWILSEYPPNQGWDVAAIKEGVRKVTEPLPDIVKHNRIPLSDKEVIDFIDEHQHRLTNPSASPLLRILRDSNYACEQSRFSKLFRKWKSANQVGEYV